MSFEMYLMAILKSPAKRFWLLLVWLKVILVWNVQDAKTLFTKFNFEFKSNKVHNLLLLIQDTNEKLNLQSNTIIYSVLLSMKHL